MTVEKKSRSIDSKMACVFWLLCITLSAAGHRMYKFVVSTDRVVSAEHYQTTKGASIVWLGYGNLNDATKRYSKNSSTSEYSLPTEALPISPFWVTTATTFTLIGMLFVWSGRWVQDHGIQSLLGLFGGHCFWIGSIELGLDAVGRRYGLSGSLEFVGGKFVGTHAAGTLIQASLVFLIPVFLGLVFHESNRCVVFHWFRKRLPILRNPVASGRVENYAARTAFQFFMTVWFCYVAVLWLADPLFGNTGPILLLVAMVVIVLSTPYMIWRTTAQSNRGLALRYSVSGSVVAWTAIEIASSMQIFDEPWLSKSTASFWFFTIASLALTILVFRGLVVQKRRPILESGMVTAVLFVAVLAISGCSANTNSENISPEEVSKTLKDYNDQISKPNESTQVVLIKALYSNEHVLRAQASIAFSKTSELTPAVVERLTEMARRDKHKLAQVAAFVALSKHDVQIEIDWQMNDSEELANEWSDLVEELVQQFKESFP